MFIDPGISKRQRTAERILNEGLRSVLDLANHEWRQAYFCAAEKIRNFLEGICFETEETTTNQLAADDIIGRATPDLVNFFRRGDLRPRIRATSSLIEQEETSRFTFLAQISKRNTSSFRIPIEEHFPVTESRIFRFSRQLGFDQKLCSSEGKVPFCTSRQ